MTNDLTILERSEFDLDVAVFLAQASSVAYWPFEKVQNWVLNDVGFSSAKCFESGNVQGYWCANNDVALLAFRGTSNPGQWLRDARFFPAEHSWGRVHIGFRNGISEVEQALAEFDLVAQGVKHIWLTGHSLGGALAVLAASRLKIQTGLLPFLYTYGQPAVGLNDFAERFSIELPSRLWHFVNQSDIVTRVPVWPYRHTGIVKRIVSPGVLEAAKRHIKAASIKGVTTESVDNFKRVTLGISVLESAKAIEDAGLDRPQLIELEPIPLTELEFSQLQLALGAAAELKTQAITEEGAIPFFSDHAIADYISLLKDIRDAQVRK